MSDQRINLEPKQLSREDRRAGLEADKEKLKQ
jgi:hypothetical protein